MQKKIFTSFEDTQNINKSKLKHTGPVVNTTLGRKYIEPLGIQTIGFVGGSQGSEEINNYVEQFLNSEASADFNVLHITGKAKNTNKLEFQNYKSFFKKIDIIVDHNERKKLIEKKFNNILKNKNIKIQNNPRLLNEVVDLTDQPNILICEFDKNF